MRHAFKTQCVDGARLTRNKEDVILHSIETGEVVAVPEANTWSWILLQLDWEQGVVLEGEASLSVLVGQWQVARGKRLPRRRARLRSGHARQGCEHLPRHGETLARFLCEIL